MLASWDACFIGEILWCRLLQIVSEADKVYGVMHANRISQIDVITRSDALAFLQSEEEQHQQQQQQQVEEPQQQQQQLKKPRHAA